MGGLESAVWAGSNPRCGRARIRGVGGLESAVGSTIECGVDAWTFIWLMFILKIPIVGLFLIVRWAVRQAPESTPEADGGIGFAPRPRHPHRPRSRPGGRGPIIPRRGPHRGGHGASAASAPFPPARIRTATARARLRQR